MKSKNLKSNDGIDCLKKIINRYCQIAEEFVIAEIEKERQGHKFNELQRVTFDFLNRNRFNIAGMLPLLELYKTNPGIIQPIGLIMRSVFSDFLTLCYLLTFCKDENQVTESFKNELHLFERDSLKMYFEVGDMEVDIEKYIKIKPENSLTRERLLESQKKMKTNFQYLFEEDGNWKLVKRLRETSDQTLFENRMAFEMPNGFVSERYKWNRIDKNEKLNKYILTYFGYKLFSQFQHYSALSMKLLREGQEYLFYYLVISIDGLCIITDLQIQLITGDNKHELLPKLKEIVGDIDKVFGKTEGKPTD